MAYLFLSYAILLRTSFWDDSQNLDWRLISFWLLYNYSFQNTNYHIIEYERLVNYHILVCMKGLWLETMMSSQYSIISLLRRLLNQYQTFVVNYQMTKSGLTLDKLFITLQLWFSKQELPYYRVRKACDLRWWRVLRHKSFTPVFQPISDIRGELPNDKSAFTAVSADSFTP